jgi:putative spermidine/putrescine transport system substrate-binding protein
MLKLPPVSKVAVASVLAMVVAFGTAVEARDLTVTAWGGAGQEAQRKAFYEPFAAKTSIKLTEDTWSGGIGVLRTKVQGGNANWDVVQVEIDELTLGCEEGLFEKLDWNMLGGRDKFIPDAVHDCGVGAIVWSVLFAYDGDKMKDGPKNWADFWDVKKYPGKRGLRKTPKYTLEAALMADGVKPQDVYKVLRAPGGVDRAFKKLDELKPHIVWYSSPSQVPGMLASGEIAASMGTASRLLAANLNDKKNFKVVWDGSMYSVDSWVILKGSPNKDKAMQLIAYMSNADNQKLIPTLLPQGITNKEAIKTVDPRTRPDIASNPDNMKNAVAVDAQFWVENADQLNQRFAAWAAK